MFTRDGGSLRYLLIQSFAGTYGFPKGHMEAGETEIETALREVAEEVGLTVELVPGFRTEEEYRLPKKDDTVKRVIYFLGEYADQNVICQPGEVRDAVLLDYETAMGLFRFESTKRILREANEFLLKG